VNMIVLLSFMLEASDTTSRPDVAPVGNVKMMDVAVHMSTGTGAPFKATKLPPWLAPKFKPLIVIWLPTDPVVPETPVMAGAGVAAELIETLSKVAVSRAVVVPLLTASPM
jgi:hypothetical protein